MPEEIASESSNVVKGENANLAPTKETEGERLTNDKADETKETGEEATAEVMKENSDDTGAKNAIACNPDDSLRAKRPDDDRDNRDSDDGHAKSPLSDDEEEDDDDDDDDDDRDCRRRRRRKESAGGCVP